MSKQHIVVVLIAITTLAIFAPAVLSQEWWDNCPPDPPTRTPWPEQPTLEPQPTYPPQPTYTPNPMPTCRPTATLAPNPSPSPYPTHVPYPTYTPYPTHTPYPTQPHVTPTQSPATPTPTVTPTPTGNIHYVSKAGNNANGASWPTAWNELNQIDWSVIQPGDTILLNGGTNAMIYTTPLVITASGTKTDPIMIALADGVGRDGQVVIDGGGGPLPYCGQTDYSFTPDYVDRVDIRGSYIIIDGTKWRGIVVKYSRRTGLRVRSYANDVTVRNLEIYENGWAYQASGRWYPDGPGVGLAGTNITFERCLIHDNGQDAFQSGGPIADFTLRQSWLYNARLHPLNPDRPFNECRHPDGIQIYGGGVQSGVLIEDSIIGPGFLQGVLLGGGGEPNPPWAVMNDVTIRNSLFFKSFNAEMYSHSNPTKPTNWTIENVTTFAKEDRRWHNIYLEGTGHVIRGSVFYGGRSMTFPDWNFVTEGNCQWKVGGKTVGQVVDPLFADVNEDDWFSLDDFTVQNSACKGSSIASVTQLIGRHYDGL